MEDWQWQISENLVRQMVAPTNHKEILDVEAKVAELIDTDTVAWNLNLVKEVFSKEEADIICQIPLSHRPD